MCTLIVLHRCVPGRPLVVAANRDEFFDRPAEGVALRSSATGPIVSPLDLKAGGTWVGLSARRVFVGLTNLRPVSADEAEETTEYSQDSEELLVRAAAVPRAMRSRGDVVMMALEAESAAKAVDAVLDLEAGAFNPFQLLVADGKEAWLVVYRGEARAIALEPGPHIVGNVVDEQVEARLGASSLYPLETVRSEPRLRKLTRIRERVEKLMTEPGRDLFEGLAGICREHVGSFCSHADGMDSREQNGRVLTTPEGGDQVDSPLESTCVHDAHRYGTRSSLLLDLCENDDAHRLWTTDGPPCEQPYENRSFLLRELGILPGDQTGTETT